MLKLVFVIIFAFNVTGDDEVGNFSDLSMCKLSHLGLEYLGDISKTESWVRCQSWSSDLPHHIPEGIVDAQFPEQSRKRAKNFCRNPTKDPDGPWCYTMNLDLKYETCGIPLCSVKECRITGPGMEYSGNIKRALSDRKCLKWNKDRGKVKEATGYKPYDKFSKIRFPEGEVSKAKKFCRNPNGDIGGPWCFVENDETDEIEKEYCDIPFCEVPDCEVFTRNTPNYTHWTDFNNTLTEFSFGVKLWDSDSYSNATARLVISTLALPVTGKEMADLGIGLEIFLSNKVSALTMGNKDTPEYEPTPDILKSTSYTMFTVSWTAPFITLSYEGQIKPIFLAEYKTKNNLLGFRKNRFNFYSAQGTNVIWSFPFCRDDFECDVQTTTGAQFQQFWPLRTNEVGQELQFYLRAFHSAYILFVPSPAVDFPNVKFLIQRSNEMSRIVVNFWEDSSVIIKELSLPEILDYWEWREYSVAFFADTMQFYWTKSVGTHMIFEIKHEIFRSLRWFSPSSDTIAHWTFFCLPPEISKPPPALLPECALNNDEENYKGTQDVTSEGMPCLPWASKLLPNQDFDNKSEALVEWNYCRDPKKDEKGTYCYAFTLDKSIEKNYCRLRKCKSEECRMAGTGNDYVGHLSKTRSNRNCDYWFENVTVHRVESQYANETLYADLSLDDVQNFCRNPSRDVGGSWCYTSDPDVQKDLCNVRDCDRPEENIMIVGKALQGRKVYILPQWKITGLEFGLKQWNPDLTDAVQFDFYPKNLDDKIELILGAKGNEKVLLFHKAKLIKEKTFLHLISSGKWTDFWLVMRKGEISLGFKGVPNSFFEYLTDEVFDPMFLSFGTVHGNPLGFFLKSEQCQTENVSISSFAKTVPFGIWSSEKTLHQNFSLVIRGEGLVSIPLMSLPNTLSSHMLQIDTMKNEVYLSYLGEILKTQSSQFPLLTTKNWTTLNFSFSEQYVNVTKENETVFTYYSFKPMLFYWFSLGMEKGWAIWSANCDALDIDGPPRDGGWSAWSPWHCTVKCGGGEGYRTRNCTNPKPNILGMLCPGSYKSTGICNDFVCGDVSPTTLEKMRENLQTHQFSFEVNEGRSVVLENDSEMLKIIRQESPDSYFEWTLNGIFVEPDENRVVFQGDNLVVRNVGIDDSGVYVCMLYRINKKKEVLRVISLAVVSEDYTIQTRATRSVVLVCKAVVLGYIYSDLSLKLYLNGEIYKDFGTTMLAAVNSEEFKELNTSHTGDWKCVVEQKDLKLSWTTNYIRMEVKKAPNFYTNLMEDEFSKPFFGWLGTENNVFYALIFIVVFVILMVLLFLFLYFKYCTVKSRWN
ncbi:uncharacterized protein LOC123011979 [Tribolium madens]|uniref:uncharacterized protein LOC123011979 n=1 Tax=Tribolium madens TaxID=41895 RepID=UPI001CF73D97|nr:uncharacterized protein LOC123011979 [Tribolium madens]